MQHVEQVSRWACSKNCHQFLRVCLSTNKIACEHVLFILKSKPKKIEGQSK